MQPKFIGRLLLIAATFTICVLCDYKPCNPLTQKRECIPNVALSATLKENFNVLSPNFEAYSTEEMISYTSDGLVLTIDSKYQNPGIKSNFYIMFGKVEAIVKAASGRGIISSVYLQSDALDEIDIEWFGGDPHEVQTNFFSKGNVTTYDRGGYHSVETPQDTFHNYTIDWTEERLIWYVDSSPVRTLYNDSVDGYPQTPMAVFLGTWAGGDPENSAGTIMWAGGATNYIGVPYDMIVSELIVSDYSSGITYSYGDKSGDWTSIEAIGGEVNGRKEEAELEFNALINGESLHCIVRRNYSEESENNKKAQARNDADDAKSSKKRSLASKPTVHSFMKIVWLVVLAIYV